MRVGAIAPLTMATAAALIFIASYRLPVGSARTLRRNAHNLSEFNLDGKPDYLLYNPSTRETVIWDMDDNVRTNAVFGPRLPSTGGWSLVAP
jgi:hypothetical protein